MATRMDRSRLREFAREFELRVIMERLEEALGADAFPDASPQEALDSTAVEGTIGDLAEGEVALAIFDSTWAAADGEQVVTGDAGRHGGAGQGAVGRPLIGHDLKSLGGGARHGLLAAAGEGNLELRHDTMVGAYLLDPARRTFDLLDIAAQRGLAAEARDDRGETRGRSARAGGGAAARPRCRGAPRLGARPAPARGDAGTRPGEADGRGRDAAGGGADGDGERGRDARRQAAGRHRQGLRAANRRAPG